MSNQSVAHRPPVVTILGHVDHGKTSLLDKIRHTSVASGEVGGITQAIGAYQIDFQGRKLTFIDTPGHAAFSEMRRRGGQVADIAILIVAADDSVMPQTRESIEHIKSANIPFVVVVNKTDLPGVNPEKVKTDLASCGVFVEGYGGNIPLVQISAKSGAGIEELLEIILLLTDLEELKNTIDIPPATAIVIESSLHPQKGPLATLLVKDGQFQKNSSIYLGKESIGKVRSMIDHSGKTISEAPPSFPFQVIGLSKVPMVGEIVCDQATDLVSEIKNSTDSLNTSDADKPNIILKADVQGSLEAIVATAKDYANIVASSVGMISETDIQTAVSTNSQIVGFNVKIGSTTARLAEVEGVQFENFRIIYQLFDYLKETQNQKIIAQGPKIIEVGTARVLKTFNFSGTIVVGALATSGKIKIGDTIQGSIVASLKMNKADVTEVKKDQEFGMVLKPKIELKEGDIISATNIAE